MKKILPFLLIVVSLLSCKETKQQTTTENDSFPVKYENDLFSISLPQGWVYDDSGWNGLDSIYNEVYLYNPNDESVWFYFVKSYLPIQWKNIQEATEYAKTARFMSGEDVALVEEIDSAYIDGYPSSILLYANLVDGDTIMQKQFVTYLQDSHILIYFNENFFHQNWNIAQKIGDELMKNIKIKDVTNPLEDKRN